jgi:hypothetical protein
VCFCTVGGCEVTIQLLRNPTFISLAEPDIFTTIEGLLWQAGLDNLLQNLLEKKLLPHSHYLRLWGYFYQYIDVPYSWPKKIFIRCVVVSSS